MKTKKLLFVAAFFILNSTFLIFNCSAQFTKLHDFTGGVADGEFPGAATPISDGTFLYGMTNIGGAHGKGVVFKVKTDGTGYTNILDFDSINGSNPQGSLISDGTFLYGMTYGGGAHDKGVVFKIMPDGTGYADILDFTGTTTGALPHGSLFYDGTFLYGMTPMGGPLALHAGNIFKIKTDGTGYSDLYDFSISTDGNAPFGDLISAGGVLYGMTSAGGSSMAGTIFKIMPDGTGFATIFTFTGTGNGGRAPYGNLFSDGTFLYGMTENGGPNNNKGIIFKIMPDGSGYTDLHDFSGMPDGKNPSGSLISDGTYLYGMTMSGGDANGDGIIFKIKPDGTGYANILGFTGTANGNSPQGSLFSDGTYLYGITGSGGTSSFGTVFKLAIAGAGITENNKAIDFSVSPNPSSGVFNLKMNGIATSQLKSIEVYNVIGEKVYQSQINNPQSEIDLSSRPGGVYFLHFQTEQGFAVKKIIISK